MPWGIAAAAIGVGGSILSSSNQADASKQASDEQYQAAQLSAQTQKDIYNQTRSDLAPYLSTGTSALSQLSSLFGLGGPGGAGATGPTAATAANTLSALQNYPGYQFQFNQGEQALDRSAASRGLLLSGAQVKDAQTYGQGVAQSSALAPYLAQLNSMAGLGENAGAITGNNGTNAANGISSSILAGGQAQAAGTVGSANALTSGLQGGLNSALLGYSMYNNNVNPADIGQGGASPLSIQPTNQIDPSLMLQNYQLSDVRTKTDIDRVGMTDDGLPIYTFRYKSGGPTQMGVMAQEVERVRPDAVRTTPSGLKMVNYGKISALSGYMDRMAA